MQICNRNGYIGDARLSLVIAWVFGFIFRSGTSSKSSQNTIPKPIQRNTENQQAMPYSSYQCLYAIPISDKPS
jgi:hypothetical protein